MCARWQRECTECSFVFVVVWRFKWVWLGMETGREAEVEKEKKKWESSVVRCLQITGKRGIYITKVKRRGWRGKQLLEPVTAGRTFVRQVT